MCVSNRSENRYSVMKEIKIGTVFSGIGSPEQALKRLNVPHKVMFACDNGERLISYDYKEEMAKIKALSSAREKRIYVDKLYAKRTRQKNYVQQSYLANYLQNYQLLHRLLFVK